MASFRGSHYLVCAKSWYWACQLSESWYPWPDGPIRPGSTVMAWQPRNQWWPDSPVTAWWSIDCLMAKPLLGILVKSPPQPPLPPHMTIPVFFDQGYRELVPRHEFERGCWEWCPPSLFDKMLNTVFFLMLLVNFLNWFQPMRTYVLIHFNQSD